MESKNTLRVLVVLLAITAYYKVVSRSVGEDRTELLFSFITALSGDSTSSGGIPIIDLALKEINDDHRILPNYTLNYTTILDSEV